MSDVGTALMGLTLGASIGAGIIAIVALHRVSDTLLRVERLAGTINGILDKRGEQQVFQRQLDIVRNASFGPRLVRDNEDR